jgi:polysaccharide export outer membrane protein
MAALVAPGIASAQQRPAAPATPAAVVADATPGAAQPGKVREDYVIGPDDVLEVEVVGRSDFRVRQKIAVDGNMLLPYIGAVPVAGKTALKVADDVKASLEKGGYFKSPVLRVEVVGFASRYVTVLGQVGSPGLVPVDRPYRMSEILARVGGVREGGAEYVVLTPEKGAEQRLSVKALATGGATQDPYVSPGDKIFIPQAELFFVSGQVKAPGAYPVKEDMTVRMALAKAGGLTDIGSEKGIKVTHPDGKVEKPGMNGKVSAGDVINVGERLF